MMKTLVVGVTGRRRVAPESIPALERASTRLTRALVETLRAPIVVCTGLAVGADSIAARAVLEEKKRRPATAPRLRAVLPMPRRDYEEDFKPDELSEFRALLARCDEVVELTAERDASNRIARTAQYVKLRDYLVDKSDVLLAYWSGDASIVKPGGTVDVVLKKIKELSDGRRGLVCTVAAPELLRVKKPDGTKTYVPEKLQNPGAISVAAFGLEDEDQLREAFRIAATGRQKLD